MKKVLVCNEKRMELVYQDLKKEGYLRMDQEIIAGDVYILPPSLNKERFILQYPSLENKKIIEGKEYYLESDLQINAKYTAQATLSVLLSLIQRDMQHISVDIIGYGRCGKAIYELLNKIGIQTRIITRQLLEGIYCHGYEQYKASEIVINTQDDICFNVNAFEECTLILDIASNQTFHEDIISSSRYYQLKGLPSKYVLNDAANLLKKAIWRYFDEK